MVKLIAPTRFANEGTVREALLLYQIPNDLMPVLGLVPPARDMWFDELTNHGSI